jgi:hypothetical protein
MTTFKVGDCVWKHTQDGKRKGTVDIVDIKIKPDQESPVYICVENGVVTPQKEWIFTPNTRNPYIYDPSDLLRPFETQEEMWYGTSLSYRSPEPEDDIKRATWQAKVKKHLDGIAEMRQRYSHFKKGTKVTWHGYWCFCLQNGCNRQGIHKGVVESEIWSNFTCYLRCTEGIMHEIKVHNLALDTSLN